MDEFNSKKPYLFIFLFPLATSDIENLYTDECFDKTLQGICAFNVIKKILC